MHASDNTKIQKLSNNGRNSISHEYVFMLFLHFQETNQFDGFYWQQSLAAVFHLEAYIFACTTNYLLFSNALAISKDHAKKTI
jgi:hypothetical protein